MMKYFIRRNGVAEELKNKETYDQINEIRSHMDDELKQKFMTWCKTVPSIFCECGGEVRLKAGVHVCEKCNQTMLV